MVISEIDAVWAALEEPLDSPTTQFIATQAPEPTSTTPVMPKRVLALVDREPRGRRGRLSVSRLGVQRLDILSVRCAGAIETCESRNVKCDQPERRASQLDGERGRALFR